MAAQSVSCPKPGHRLPRAGDGPAALKGLVPGVEAVRYVGFEPFL